MTDTDTDTVSNVGDIPADKGDAKGDAKASAKPSVAMAKDSNGKDTPKLDFLTESEAADQAKALGKGAFVEPIGVAYHVNSGKE